MLTFLTVSLMLTPIYPFVCYKRRDAITHIYSEKILCHYCNSSWLWLI